MTITTEEYVTIHYRCRDIGYGTEAGAARGWFTGEVDTWGKHTFVKLSGKQIYLFEDEITSVEPIVPSYI